MPTLAPPPPAAPDRTPNPPAPSRPGVLSTAELRERGLPPDGAEMSAREYDRLSLGTNLLVEWVDGRIEYLPMPTRTHQRIILDLARDLEDHAKASGLSPEVVVSPFIVRVNGRRREPDVCFLKDRDDPRGGELRWTGADLLVEVVSPSNPRRDTEEKRVDYAAAGVPEYWIIDPRPRSRTITVLVLDGGEYRGDPVGDGGTAASALLPGFAVDVTACLDAR